MAKKPKLTETELAEIADEHREQAARLRQESVDLASRGALKRAWHGQRQAEEASALADRLRAEAEMLKARSTFHTRSAENLNRQAYKAEVQAEQLERA